MTVADLSKRLSIQERARDEYQSIQDRIAREKEAEQRKQRETRLAQQRHAFVVVLGLTPVQAAEIITADNLDSVVVVDGLHLRSKGLENGVNRVEVFGRRRMDGMGMWSDFSSLSILGKLLSDHLDPADPADYVALSHGYPNRLVHKSTLESAKGRPQ